MPTNTESLNVALYRLLSKYNPKPLDAEGKVTPVPEEADIFKFEFTKDGEDYGSVYVTLDDNRKMIVYFGDDVANSPDEKTPGLDYDDTWTGLHDQLSAWRMTKGLKGIDFKNKDRVGDDMARRNHMRNKDKIAEGYYPMGRKASYSDAIPTVKIVIEHSRVIEEGEKRYRNINKIFLENQEGERYLLDTKKPGIARVYARHIAEGGKVNDDRWNHVHSLCEEYSKMAGFVRATRNGQFNESAQSLVNEGIAHYQSLRESLSRMTGKRGYNAYFESWTPALMEDEGDETNLNELFVQETLDPRIESVMPILNRIHKKVSESTIDKEINKLAEWADSLTEDESLTSNNPVGIPEDAHSSDFFMDIVDNHDGDVRGIMHDLRSLGLHSEIIKFCQWAREQGIADIFEAMKLAKEIDLENDDENEMAYEGYLRAIELLGPSEVDEAIHTGAALKKYRDNRFAPQNEPAKPAPEEEGVAEDSSENKYSKLSNRGVNRGINRASDDFTRMMDLDQVESPHYKTQHQQDTKQRLKTKPMAGPKGHLPEQAMSEDSHEEQVARLAAYNERMAGETPPIDLGLREVSNWAKVGHHGDPIKTAWYNIAKYGIRQNRFNNSVEKVMSAIGEFPNLEDEVYDMYDINQDEVDALYHAYETVYDQYDQLQGATNENFINQVDQAVTSEGEHTQHAMRGRNPGANEFEHDFENDTIGNIHDKISKMLKRLEKPKHEPNMKDTDLGNTLHEAAPWEDEDEEDKDEEDKDKKPKDTKGSDGSEHGGHSRAKHLAKQAIPKDDKKEVSEGQDDLNRILTIMNHRR